MRVLMLGWEFPPHATGGLGAACEGLARGLVESGARVRVVVPRQFGDEAFEGLVGANRVRFSRRAGSAAEDAGPEVARALETRAVASSLQPYESAAAYERRVGGGGPGPVVSVHGAGVSAHGAGVSAHGVGARASGSRSFEFLGGYGPQLGLEVERYADVVAALAADEPFDVIHAHDWMTIPAALAVKARTGRPLVLHVHSCEWDRSPEPDPAILSIEQAGLDGADSVMCVSRFTRDLLLERYRIEPERLGVLHNAVHRPSRPARPARPRIRAQTDDPLVLFLGRMTHQKGPGYFLEAAARVLDAEPSVRFVMAGAGDLLGETIEQAAELGIARRVRFTGGLRGPEVDELYARADVYVMPSVSEPFGLTTLEALCLETPVVLSRQSGVAEVLPRSIQVDYWDTEGMADRILALLHRPELARQVVEQGREDMASLTWNNRGAALRDHFAGLLP
jgi:glycosyltransferase involved in cell wall biosynthesis